MPHGNRACDTRTWFPLLTRSRPDSPALALVVCISADESTCTVQTAVSAFIIRTSTHRDAQWHVCLKSAMLWPKCMHTLKRSAVNRMAMKVKVSKTAPEV